MSRFMAAFYHFLISLVVFVVLAWLVLFQWFPGFFFAIDGGWEGLRIIIGVDLVLGPLLTLLVFKQGKRGLKLDLTLIGLFQSVCLIAGVFVVYSERPLFFIYYDAHFYSASADSFKRYGAPLPDPARFSTTLPAAVAITVPDDPIEEANQRRVLFQAGRPYWTDSDSFVPLAEQMDEVLASGLAEAKLRERDTGGVLAAWLTQRGGTAADYAFFPVHSRYRDAFIAIRKSDQTFEDIVEIAPPL